MNDQLQIKSFISLSLQHLLIFILIVTRVLSLVYE